MSSGGVSGPLPPGIWWPVVSGVGFYSVNYSVWIDGPGGKYHCYIAPVPWPISSGDLPQENLTFQVVGGGNMFLWAPEQATYHVVPVSG